MEPTGIDATAFGAIAAETERSLETVAAALDQWQASRVAEALPAACAELAQVRGVLEVAGAVGMPQVIRELEALLEDLAQGRAPAAETALAAARDALAAVRAGIADSAQGAWPQVPAAMLQDLIDVRGGNRSAEMELFHPDLTSLQPQPDATAPAAAADRERLRGARTRFQKGLLSWLRDAEPDALLAMRDAVESVESACADWPTRAPWWVAAGFLDLLVAGRGEARVDARHVFAALDQHLRRLIEGSAGIPESLMREMLYQIAATEFASGRVTAIRKTFLRSAMASAHGAAASDTTGARERRRQDFQDLEQLWERAAHADRSSLKTFLAGIESAVLETPDPNLAGLLAQIHHAGAALPGLPSQARASLALEVATALLFVQDRASRRASSEAATTDPVEIETLANRLRAAETGQVDDTTPRLDRQDAAFRLGNEELLAGSVAAELLAALGTATQALGRYFEDQTASDALEPAESALTRVRGVLEVLGEDRAAAATRFCTETIARFRAPEEARDSDDRARVAAVLSGLSYYVEQRAHDRPDLAAIMRKAGAPEWIGTDALPAAPEQVPDLSGCLEEAVEKADAGAAAAMQAAPAAPDSVQDGSQEDGQWDRAADAEMLQVFTEEALKVLSALHDALARLRGRRDDGEALATIRRCFHTLKGSGQMLELKRFGEAAGAVEQVMNTVIQHGAQADADLLRLLELASLRFSEWVAGLQSQGRARIDSDTLHSWAGDVRRGQALPVAAEARSPAAPVPTSAEQPPPESDAAERTVEIGTVRVSRTLFDIFLTEARNIVAALRAELDAIKAEPGNAPGYELFRLAHTLGGIAATVGIDAIRDLAGALERAAQLLHFGKLRTSADDRALFGEVSDELQAMVARIATRELPPPRSDLQAELSSLAQRLNRELPGDLTSGSGVVFGESGGEPGIETFSLSVEALPPSLSTGMLAASEFSQVKEVDRRRSRLEDDIDSQLLPVFLDEAADLVPRIGAELRLWRASPEERALPQSLARLLHTLKGSARMAGAMGLGELTHSMETRVSVAAQFAVIPQSVFDGLEASYDRIGVLLERLAPGAEVQPAAGASAAISAGAVPGDTIPGSTTSTAAMALAAAAPAGSATAVGATSAGVSIAPLVPTPLSELGGAEDQIRPQKDPARTRAQLRVRADLVEKMVADAGEVAIARSRAEGEVRTMRVALRDMADNLSRLRTLARELEIQAESQIQSRIVQAQGAEDVLDPLEFDRFTRLQELTRFIAESASDVATLHQGMGRSVDGCDMALAAQSRTTRMLQDGLMGVRMAPFSSLNERLYRVVRLTAKEAGKRASLDIRGAAIELDRGVIERITASLEHLLRNAVVHGIEPAAERRAAGKPEAGEITLDLHQEGNEVLLVVQDDGRGLDIPALREKAVAAGLMTSGQLLGDAQVAQFAFAPGVSTARKVTEAAGRGVGLDVVRNEVASVSGRVDVAFEAGKGTTFTIHLPLKVAVMQALLVRCAGQVFALPTLMVEQIRTFDRTSLARVQEAGRVDWHGSAFPIHELRLLLELEDAVPQSRRYAPLVLVRGGLQRAAIHVDEIAGHEEVVVKNIGAQVARVTGITGAAVRGSGEIVLILNPLQLTRRQLGRPAQTTLQQRPAVMPSAAVTVLVVDDSATVRKVTGRVLSRQGYQVVEARDGIEALEKMQSATPGVMLLDVEMPRMDGFELLRRVREDSRWKDLPIIMITSRTADKHRQVAMQLGATLFLGKPFEEQDLLAQVAQVLAGRTA